ncbi:uncharacterized protein PAE49_013247 isoform 2-T2 [Odontesthes bonariensis]
MRWIRLALTEQWTPIRGPVLPLARCPKSHQPQQQHSITSLPQLTNAVWIHRWDILEASQKSTPPMLEFDFRNHKPFWPLDAVAASADSLLKGRSWARAGPELGRSWAGAGPELGRSWAGAGPELGRAGVLWNLICLL